MIKLHIKESIEDMTWKEFIKHIEGTFYNYFPYGYIKVLPLSDKIILHLWNDKDAYEAVVDYRKFSEYPDLFSPLSVDIDVNGVRDVARAIRDNNTMSYDSLHIDDTFGSTQIYVDNYDTYKIGIDNVTGDADMILDTFNSFCQSLRATVKRFLNNGRIPEEFIIAAERNVR